ncbi:MAG: hypothetical protein ACTSPB_25285 [Candidatus Thorarchaeota archaeon]|tara:strand:- start:633 stop:1028 length:396 start_codon:yes stop_codon:yes gene_type:complete
MSLIRNRKKVRQVIDFTGVQNGRMHPSDIDAVLEFNNDVLILMEVKYRRQGIPTGQKLLLERICDSWHTDKACVLKVEHEFNDDDVDIPLHECRVTGFYNRRHWIYYKDPILLVDYLNELGVKWDCAKCKF